MDPLALALQFEKEAEAFYLDLAAQEHNPELQVIFKQLAADEVKHYQVFQSMHQQAIALTPTTILPEAATLLRQMVAVDFRPGLNESNLILYKKAMELEQRSRDFYLEQATAGSNTANSRLFQEIAAEEEKHYWLLHNIYELVLRPQTWVENGEFNHLEDY